MQKLGTEVGRNIESDVWIKILERRIKQYWKVSLPQYNNIVVTDTRFQNEAESLSRLGFKIAAVQRSSLQDNDSHASEQELKQIKTDFIIENNGDLKKLYRNIDAALGIFQK